MAFWSSLAFAAVTVARLAAAATRNRAWRWTGAALSGVALAAVTLGPDAPWPSSGISPLPLDVAWIATPALLLVAFVLLPARRSGQDDAP